MEGIEIVQIPFPPSVVNIVDPVVGRIFLCFCQKRQAELHSLPSAKMSDVDAVG